VTICPGRAYLLSFYGAPASSPTSCFLKATFDGTGDVPFEFQIGSAYQWFAGTEVSVCVRDVHCFGDLFLDNVEFVEV